MKSNRHQLRGREVRTRRRFLGRTPGKPIALIASLFAVVVCLSPAGSPAGAASADPVNEARTKLFGPGWDQPGVVRARSVGNTTWLVSYGGTVILHDSTIEDQLTDTGEDANTNGYVSLADVIAAKPEAILQDHTHFDQQHSAVELTTQGDIPIVTDLGGCLFTKLTAVKKGANPADVKCNLIRDSRGRPFFTPDTYFIPVGQGTDLGIPDLLDGLGLNLDLNLLGQDTKLGDFLAFTDYGVTGRPETPLPGGLSTKAVMIKHSPTFFSRPYPENMSGPNLDPLTAVQEMLEDYGDATPQEIADNIWAIYAPFDLEGSNVAWLVKYREFSLLHHGSTGPTNNIEPGAPEVREALSRLSPLDRIDVEIGSLAEQVFHWNNGQYFEDQKQYARYIGAKQYFPTHHYNWFPMWLTNPAVAYWPGMQETWADGHNQYERFPRMCYLTEDNYASVFTFRTAEWQGASMPNLRQQTGPGCYRG